MYAGSRLEEGPRDISKYGLPSDLQNPDAAFVWAGNKKTYFFKGINYWRYNEKNAAVDAGYPRPISVWGKKPARMLRCWLGSLPCSRLVELRYIHFHCSFWCPVTSPYLFDKVRCIPYCLKLRICPAISPY